MVMSTHDPTIAAADFKARCLALLDRVAATGESLTVTKRGKPVARVVPAKARRAPSLRRSVTILGDLTAPILDPWDVER